MSLLYVLNKIMKTIEVKYKIFFRRLTEICVLIAEKPIYKILLKKRQIIIEIKYTNTFPETLQAKRLAINQFTDNIVAAHSEVESDLIILSCNKKRQIALNNKLHIIESDDNFGILINVYS